MGATAELVIAGILVLLILLRVLIDFNAPGETHQNLRRYIRLILGVIFVVLLVLLHPPKPHPPQFVLQVNKNFNISHPNPNLLNLSIEITLYSKNPNHKNGIYYDTLNVYASYRNLQVTSATPLPERYQGEKDVIFWSSVLIGSVPVLGDFSMALEKDLKEAQFLPLSIKVDGLIRFKEGSKLTGFHHLSVRFHAFTRDCDVYLW